MKVNMKENYIGSISNYFSNISVAAFVIESGKLKTGDTVHIKGHTTDIKETVSSIQMEHEMIETAKKGDDIGIKVSQKVWGGDKVFVVADNE